MLDGKSVTDQCIPLILGSVVIFGRDRGFPGLANSLAQAGDQSQPGTAWKGNCELRVPLAALAPELARADR